FLLSYNHFKSKKVAIIASLIYAVSPFSFFFDRMALVDSLLSAFGVWTLFFALVAIRQLRLDFAMLSGFALGGGLLTKSPAIFYALMLPLTWLFTKFPREKMGKVVHLIKLLALFLVTLVIGVGMYNILRLGPNFNMIAHRNIDYIYPLEHLLTRPLDPFLPFINRSFEWIWSMGPSLTLVFALLALLN
ncbi:MAG: glycosyltransferase family 39 protein, partial [Patescibacteria group bacterium]